jgi:hypothetical protein
MGDDMRAAADVIEGVVGLQTGAHPALDPSSLSLDTLAAAWLAFQAIAEILPDGPQRHALRLAGRIATSLSDLRSEVSEVITKSETDNFRVVDAARELRRALEETAKVDGAPPIAPAAGEG